MRKLHLRGRKGVSGKASFLRSIVHWYATLRLRRYHAMTVGMFRSHLSPCGSLPTDIPVAYLDAGSAAFQTLRRNKSPHNPYAGLPMESIASSEDFCAATGEALSLLKEFRPRHYQWMVKHGCRIANIPAFNVGAFYSFADNTFFIDFFLRGFPKDGADYYWHCAWLAGTIDILYVHARISKHCPHALALSQDRIYERCIKHARKFAVLASNDDYEFSEMF